MRLDVNPDSGLVVVTLSRRNLDALSATLNDATSPTPLTTTNCFRDRQSTNSWTLVVVAETDDSHYGSGGPPAPDG